MEEPSLKENVLAGQNLRLDDQAQLTTLCSSGEYLKISPN